MKYLKKFENFEAQDEMDELNPTQYDMELHAQDEMDDMREEEEEEFEEQITLEKKKLPAALKAYLDKKKGKDDKKSTSKSKAKPDFLDLDKDGDKKEPMKKAAKDAKSKTTPAKKK